MPTASGFGAFAQGVRHSRRRFLATAASAGIAALAAVRGECALARPKPTSASGAPPMALVHDQVCKTHQPDGPDRPESPKRYDAVLGELKRNGSLAAIHSLRPREATDEEILACHGDAYLERITREIESGAQKLSTGDTYVCRRSLKAAHYAAGGACVAVEAVVKGQAKNAFCLTRPPGHHATANRGMGFCVLNNVAIAARFAQRSLGVGKVLIIDWDCHHGNGTQDIFYEDGSVFFFSTHQSPWYPWTGAKEETGRGKGLGTTLNCPLARGSGRKEFFTAFQRMAEAAHRFKPELVLLSAGFDSRHGDPLGRLELADQDYVDLTSFVLDIARDHCQGRVASILEGGYSLTGLASAAAAHIGCLQRA
jgi:acetoin utilization deacetylase AcuC-like enzyme